MLKGDENVHTPLGFIAYAVGVRLPSDATAITGNIQRAFAALCALFAVQLGIEYAGDVISIPALFEYLREQFPVPAGIEQGVYDQVLAIGMYCTIQTRPAELFDPYIANQPLSQLSIVSGDANDSARQAVFRLSQATPASQIPALLELDHLPRRRWRYWAASRGLYTYASKSYEGFFKGVGRICRVALAGGQPNPFASLIQKPADQAPADVFRAIENIVVSDAEAGEEWNRIVKSLYDGVIDSLPFLHGQPVSPPRVFFARGKVTGDLTAANPTIIVPRDSCVSMPAVGDRIKVEDRVFRIESVEAVDRDVRIVGTPV